jgi:hypothetical protein
MYFALHYLEIEYSYSSILVIERATIFDHEFSLRRLA